MSVLSAVSTFTFEARVLCCRFHRNLHLSGFLFPFLPPFLPLSEFPLPFPFLEMASISIGSSSCVVSG